MAQTAVDWFADNIDDWCDTLKQAQDIYKEFKRDGYTNIRIYKESWSNIGTSYEQCDENYYQGIGNFPS